MLLFFYGEDTYSSLAKTRLLKEKFLATHSEAGLIEVDCSSLESAQLVELFRAQGLWSHHRLIIFRDFFAYAKAELRDELASLIEQLPADTTLLFLELGLPDRRLKLFSRLLALAKTQEFTIAGGRLDRQLDHMLQEKNATISPELRSRILDYAQADTWLMATELDKVISAPDDSVALASVGTNRTQAEFALQDAIANRDPKQALTVLVETLSQKPDPSLALGALAGQLRSLILISKGQAQASGIHPFVVRKLTPLSAARTTDYWVELLQELSGYDWKIKTGAAQGDASLQIATAKLTFGS